MRTGRRHRPAGPGTVLVVGPVPPPVHGASRVTQAVIDEVCDRAARSAREVAIVSTSGDGSRGAVGYHLSRVRAHLRAARRLTGARVLYLGGAGGVGLWYQLGLAALARARGVGVVFHHHSYGYLVSRSAVVGLLVRVVGAAGTHVCLSPSMARALASRYRPTGRVLTVSNARFVPDGGPRARGSDRSTLRLVHVSNLCREKGSVRVVEAFERLRARGTDVALALVGEATDDDVRRAVERARRDHPGSFRHHGRASRDEVVRALDGADLFLFPSTYRYEAQPMVVLEALARGVPVLAGDRGALRDLLPDRWLLDGDGDGALDEAVRRFVADELPGAAATARRVFERSRHGGDDLVDVLLA